MAKIFYYFKWKTKKPLSSW